MAIEQVAFAIATISIGFGILASLKGLPARLALAALAVFVLFVGPKVFGQSWYQEGFIAGLFFGDFYGTVCGREEVEEKEKKLLPRN